jgi:hypothetical protein
MIDGKKGRDTNCLYEISRHRGDAIKTPFCSYPRVKTFIGAPRANSERKETEWLRSHLRATTTQFYSYFPCKNKLFIKTQSPK